MKILLVGSGAVTSSLVQKLSEQGHTISAMLGNLTPSQLEVHDHSGVVVISPETTTSTETLTKAAELGKLLYVIAGAQDSIAGWAATTGTSGSRPSRTSGRFTCTRKPPERRARRPNEDSGNNSTVTKLSSWMRVRADL